ncbi:hypothetical protein Bbelb_107330 [Branchiostoma belcheri]|nr:hypothetical protein Bbelb_107330 [Branchiostoma belcheri]
MPYHTRKSSKNDPTKKRKFSSTSSQTEDESSQDTCTVCGHSDLKTILEKIQAQLEDLEALRSQVRNDAVHIVNLSKASQHVEEEVDELRKEVKVMSEKLKTYEEMHTRLEKEKVTAQHKQVQMEANSRRENLLFYNIQEETNEKPKETEKLLAKISYLNTWSTPRERQKLRQDAKNSENADKNDQE